MSATTSTPSISPVPALIPLLGIIPTANEPKMIHQDWKYTLGHYRYTLLMGSTAHEDNSVIEVCKKLDTLTTMAGKAIRARILMEKPFGWCGLETDTNVIRSGNEKKEIWDLTVRCMAMLSDGERNMMNDDDVNNLTMHC